MLKRDLSSCRQTVGKTGWPARWALRPCAKASTPCGRGGQAAASGGADNSGGYGRKAVSLYRMAVAAVQLRNQRGARLITQGRSMPDGAPTE
jgi:hypothetical protein